MEQANIYSTSLSMTFLKSGGGHSLLSISDLLHNCQKTMTKDDAWPKSRSKSSLWLLTDWKRERERVWLYELGGSTIYLDPQRNIQNSVPNFQ